MKFVTIKVCIRTYALSLDYFLLLLAFLNTPHTCNWALAIVILPFCRSFPTLSVE